MKSSWSFMNISYWVHRAVHLGSLPTHNLHSAKVNEEAKGINYLRMQCICGRQAQRFPRQLWGWNPSLTDTRQVSTQKGLLHSLICILHRHSHPSPLHKTIVRTRITSDSKCTQSPAALWGAVIQEHKEMQLSSVWMGSLMCLPWAYQWSNYRKEIFVSWHPGLIY